MDFWKSTLALLPYSEIAIGADQRDAIALFWQDWQEAIAPFPY
ncbi:MAG: hypothetical protein AAGD25_12605 [Cyanobacteria bacterium P01_F01_bin.150]